MQARALETRSKILTQAEIAFARHGFDATSLTSDILDPAGVSVGSFYHQFENKTEVLLALIDERLTRRRSSVVELIMDAEASFPESVSRTLEALMDDIDTGPDAWWVMFRERQHPDPAIHAVIEVAWQAWAEIARGLVDRCYEGEPDRIDAAASMAVFVLAGVLRDYLGAGEPGRAALRRRIPEAASFCAAGVERVLGAASESRSAALAP